RLEKLQLINSVIVESPYFKAAVVEMDAATTLDSAQTMVEQVGSDFMIVTDVDGRVVARTDIPALTGVDLSATPLVGKAIEGESFGGVWREENRLYHAVSVPFGVGEEILGAVVTGYEIDDELAQDIKRFAECEVVFFAKTEAGYQEAGTTLAESTTALRDWLSTASVPAESEDVRLPLQGETFQAIFAPLATPPHGPTDNDEPVGLFAALRSRDRELAGFRSFQRSVLLVGLLGVAVAVGASHFLASGIARPLRKLVTITDRIREGDYSSDVEAPSGGEIGALASAFRSLLGELREKQVMEKFLSKSAAEMIQKTDPGVAGMGERRPVTVLFSDLKAHAAFKEGNEDPKEVLRRVNHSLSRQSELVERYGGQVDKFVGDRMMAIFKGEDKVWPAIRCAISIQHLLDSDGDKAALVPGIGVSTGDAVFGAVGSSSRLDYSLLGRAVHVAGRLADEALPGDVLLSQEAYAKVQDRASAEALPPLKLQGIEEAVPVYSLSTGTIRQQKIASARTASGPSGTSAATLVDGKREKPALTLSSLEPGTVLVKRYEIRRVLGSGGMGMVFQAHDRDLDEPVALKILRPEIAGMDPQILERFKTEIRVARRIAHRNVVRTYDFGDADGIKFISMEFIQGMTLKQLFRSKGALPLGVGLQIAKQAAAGLVAAHDMGVVHRDVKPHNIMLTPQSDVKIMDFGIVRDTTKSEGSGMTQTGTIMGTPDYMSPEQAMGKGDLDHRSDVYSFGVVLYEMFTGALPFRGESPIAIALKHIQEEPKAPRAVNPKMPPELESIIQRAMRKPPESRYPTMADLLADLYRLSKAAER
ncbi:MAG TPA: protein kinase, partial [Vicinamibacteria bacterium]|nr:protein kinase [Vicinamibacteria bacterium]